MAEEVKEKKHFKMPSAIVLLFMVLVAVAIVTWFVPTSVAVTAEDGTQEIIFNAALDADGNVIENAGPDPKGLWDVLYAPIQGFSDGAAVSMAILISGGLLALLSYTGAMNAGVGALLKHLKGNALIAALMFFFAITGAVYGAWEELPAYAFVIIPLCVTAGYDAMTGFLIIFIGATVGNMGSIVNPYSIGAAVAAIGNPELSLGTGIVMRILLFAVMYLLATFLVMRYAAKVKANPRASVIANIEGINNLTDMAGSDEEGSFPEMNGRHAASLLIFGLVVVFLIMGYMPWASIPVGDGTMYDVINGWTTFLATNVPFLSDLLGAGSFTWFGDWYFNEYGVVFLLATILIVVINRIPQDVFVEEFVKGAADLVSLVIVISICRGISAIIGTSEYGMSVTFVYWIQNALSSVPMWAFALAAFAAYFGIGFAIQSTSAVAGMTMSILGAVAMALFAGTAVSPEAGQMVLISAFTMGLNLSASGLFPEASKMGVLELTGIPYPTYLAVATKMFIPVTIAGLAVLMLAPYIGIAG
ncbi:YfcC family protein [Enorma burkinafasonensis]|uniref:YfcC family protein n=1 Tax=Enorma burkinafasonensis TaxID=2590867 RepID=UPI0011A0D934|nr:YfcC family protein [Enorma burkinafasonensis]